MLSSKKSHGSPYFFQWRFYALDFSLLLLIYFGGLWALSQVLLLMRNLSVNLTSPEFEDHVSRLFYALYFFLSMVFCFIYTTYHDASVIPKTVAAYSNYGDVILNM